jgi:hypothetical protein
VSNAERQKRYREKKAAKVTKRVPAPKVAAPKAPLVSDRVASLEVQVALLKAMGLRLADAEDRIQALEQRQNPEVYYPKPTITELRQRVATVTGPRPPVYTEDPGDAP